MRLKQDTKAARKIPEKVTICTMKAAPMTAPQGLSSSWELSAVVLASCNRRVK
jgi:hypothetical protein